MLAEFHRKIGRKKFGGRAGCYDHGRLNHRSVMRESTAVLTHKVAA